MRRKLEAIEERVFKPPFVVNPAEPLNLGVLGYEDRVIERIGRARRERVREERGEEGEDDRQERSGDW